MGNRTREKLKKKIKEYKARLYYLEQKLKSYKQPSLNGTFKEKIQYQLCKSVCKRNNTYIKEKSTPCYCSLAFGHCSFLATYTSGIFKRYKVCSVDFDPATCCKQIKKINKGNPGL